MGAVAVDPQRQILRTNAGWPKLSDPAMLSLMDPHFETRVRFVLSEVLREEKRPADAEAVLAPACAAEKSGPLRDAMDRDKLCR